MKDLHKMLSYLNHPYLNSLARITIVTAIVVIISLLTIYSFTRYPAAEVSPTGLQTRIPVWSPSSSLTFGYTPIPLYVPLMPVPTLDASTAAAVAPVVIPFPEPSPEPVLAIYSSPTSIADILPPVFVPPVTIEPVVTTPMPPVTTIMPVTITPPPVNTPQATPLRPPETRTWLQSLARSFHDTAKDANQNDNKQGDNDSKGKNNGKGKGTKGKD